jgi:cytoskeletal protein CcmA (bactofilin family)
MALKDFMTRTQTAEPARYEPAPPVATSRPATQSPAQASSHTSYLGPSFAFSGELHSGESLRIDGKVKGEVRCDGQITVGDKGSVHATIDGDVVVIAGEVQGDIKARRKITLESTARVTGDLSTPGIVIQEGARLEGRIMISGAPAAAEPRVEAEPKARERAAGAPASSSPSPAAARPPVIASGA